MLPFHNSISNKGMKVVFLKHVNLSLYIILTCIFALKLNFLSIYAYLRVL